MSFEVKFEHVLPAGTCVAVSLPAGEDFAPPSVLHPDEAAFVHSSPAARRATFIGGRVALRAAMAALGGGAADAATPILSTPRGAPAMPTGFVGSISHKRELAVAIAARAAPTPLATIGIDVEIARPPRTDIAPRVLTAAERAALAGLDDRARDAAVLFRFAAKEAIYKALDPWVQRLVSFQEVEIVTGADGGWAARLSLSRGEGPFNVALHDASRDGLVLVTAAIERAR
ncbi:MAG TPA: 4'-phosphopantetheinyl transferase superfamily protein [Polyangia bacterium]|nr:4'-phosphopantetheinyl transferase superfamily protein [Polyangia bacterium]